MKEYQINPKIYTKLKNNFGMWFFHRIDDRNRILIQPVTESTFKDMVALCGKKNFTFIRFVNPNFKFKKK